MSPTHMISPSISSRTSPSRDEGHEPSPRSSVPRPDPVWTARTTQAGPRTDVAVVARELCKSVGSGRDRQPILRGISLQAQRGETVFLVGPSGSGKTTLLSILGCILKADQGDLEVLGDNVTRMGPDALAAFRLQHFGFIFQNFNLLPTLSALDNLRLALAIRGVSSRQARQRAIELLDRVGLAHQARVRPGRLSTGECQRVAVARALAGDPTLLLADEPTASLDAENGQAIMQLLSDLARDRGATLLIVTHDNRIFPFADQILRLEDGRMTDGRSVEAGLAGRAGDCRSDAPGVAQSGVLR